MSGTNVYRFVGPKKDLLTLQESFCDYGTALFPAPGLLGLLRLRWVLEVYVPV